MRDIRSELNEKREIKLKQFHYEYVHMFYENNYKDVKIVWFVDVP